MKFKKFAAVAAALAVLAAAEPVMGLSGPLSVTASAAEEKLVTGTLDAAITEKLLGENHTNLGNGYFAMVTQKTIQLDEFMSTSYNAVDKIIRIGDKEIANWRSTGKLEPTEIKSDVDLSNATVSGDFSKDNYLLCNDHTKDVYSVLKLDEASGKLTKVYDIGEGSVSSCGNGYCIGYESSMRGTNITAVYTPKGEKIDLTDKSFKAMSWTANGMGKYLAYAISMSDFTKLYGICTDGSFEEVYTASDVSSLSGGNGYVQIGSMMDPAFNIILTADGKTYNIGEIDRFDKITSVYGTSAVLAAVVGYDENTWQDIYNYKLINIADNGKELSKTYKFMETVDYGNTYLVQSEDGKWGYIDGTGKELAMFDGASHFAYSGKYAPVVQDGKGWLVDKNMNQVTEKIDATGCTTYGEELFLFKTADGGNVWVTSPESGKDTSAVKPGNSGSSGNSTALTDKNAGVSVNGDFPSGTTLKASKKKKDDNTYTVDISPVDASGNKVQPNGAAVVMAMIPELKGKTVNVYSVNNGNYTKLNSWVDGDGIFFTTTHFSEFEITTETRTEANPNTGFEGIAGLAAVGLALAGVTVVCRRKK